MLETASENVNLTTAGHDTKRFEFGKNWQKFLTRLNDQRINEAGKSLQFMLHRDSLEGLSFLDIGCGSGLFSLAALRLGAEKVFSFDYDPQSVACTLSLKEKCLPDDPTWVVSQGSVLDDHFMKSLGQWDIVYSWGVLHHTGDLWKGMANSILPVKENGCLFIAIYNDQGLASRIWYWVKKTYNFLPSGLRFIILIPAFARLWGPTIVKDLFRGCPMKNWKNYYCVRGMSPWEDVVDWVGGFPFEVAKPDEIFHFFHRQGFELEELFTSNNLGCNQFVFVRRK